MKIICGLLAMSIFGWAQDTPTLNKTERKLIQLKYVDANRARGLAGTFAGRDLQVDADDRLHWIAVRGPADMVAAFEEAVKKLDVAPLGFELTVYLVAATPQAADHLPDALASTAKQLHGVFAYKGYDLLDSFVLRGRDGQGTNGPGASAEGTIKTSTYSFRYNRAAVLDGTPKIVSLQNLNLQIRTPDGRFDEHGNARYKSAGVNTDIDIRDGQKVVVGKSDVNNGESPLILVVTAKVVE
jgi:hypothetical protein